MLGPMLGPMSVRMPAIVRRFYARMGRRGGKARARKLSGRRRRAIAQAAARARWDPAKKMLDRHA